MKTSISRVELKAVGRYDEYEAHLWKNDADKTLSVSLPDPFDGIKSSKDLKRLGTALIKWAKKMESKGQ